jgi:hypothetical protein
MKVRALSTTLLLFGLCIGVAPSLRASVSFTSGNGASCNSGASLCFTSGGVSVTATAFSTTGGSNTTLATATLGQYSYGLGVCNSNETVGGCSTSNPPEHAVSNELDIGVSPNVKNYDFILLQLSVPLSSIQLTLSPFNSAVDMDATYITGNCLAANGCTSSNLLTNIIGKLPTVSGTNNLTTITGVTGVALNNYTGVGQTAPKVNNVYQDQVVNVLGIPTGGVNWILIGANTTNSDGYPDYFKLEMLSTPEPATFGLAGAALAALGLLRRKKLLAKS